MTILRDAARRTVEDPEFKEAMAKVETPIAYLDAPAFTAFLDRRCQAAGDRGRAHRQGAGEVGKPRWQPRSAATFSP